MNSNTEWVVFTVLQDGSKFRGESYGLESDAIKAVQAEESHTVVDFAYYELLDVEYDGPDRS